MNNDLYLVCRYRGVPLESESARRRDKEGFMETMYDRERCIEGLITVACCNTCHYPQTDRLTSYLLIIYDGTTHTITCVIFLLGPYRVFVIAIASCGAISYVDQI